MNNDKSFLINNHTTRSQKKNKQINSQKYLKFQLTKLN